MSTAEIAVSVVRYNPAVGVVAPGGGGTVTVDIVSGSVEIVGNLAGLGDLARLCLALSDPDAPSGVHIHLDPGVGPLDSVLLLSCSPGTRGAPTSAMPGDPLPRVPTLREVPGQHASADRLVVLGDNRM